MMKINAHKLGNRCVHFSSVTSSKQQCRNVTKQLLNSTIHQQEWRERFEQQAKKQNIHLDNLYQLDPRYLDGELQEFIRKKFKKSVYRAVSFLFPEKQWLPWNFEFQSVPRNFWNTQANQRMFFDNLGTQLGIKTPDDWYEKLSTSVVEQHGGSTLLGKHKSTVAALIAAYPEHNWNPWRFNVVPTSIWTTEFQRRYFDWLGNELGIKELDDWYDVLSMKVIQEHHGRSLLELHEHSAAKALMYAYPEHTWYPWKFAVKPPGYFQSVANRQQFVEWLGKQIGVKHMDDWYEKLSCNVLRKNGATLLVEMYEGSLLDIMKSVYPDHKWEDKFERSKSKDGALSVRQLKYTPQEVRKLFDAQGLSEEDWYNVSLEELNPILVQLVKKEYRGRIPRALAAVYPEISWIPWKFANTLVHKGCWTDRSNHRKFLDYLGQQLGVKTPDDWYQKASVKAFRDYGGHSLISHYHGSPSECIMSVYSEHTWTPFRFNVVPSRYWTSLENQKKYMDWLGQQLGVKELDDWYQKLSQKALFHHGGGSLLTIYNGSPVAILMAVYPNHNWVLWRFSAAIQIWRSKENVGKFVAELSEKLSIRTLDDWYRVDLPLLKKFRASAVIQKYRGLYNLLKDIYPHHPWDVRRFHAKGKKTQRWLAVTLKKIFPDEEIVEDYIHPKALFPNSQRPMQLDVFIPSRSLAFEYQGIQHYQDVGVFSPSKTYQQRDEEKRVLCDVNNIKLIEVPYWWNRTQEQLQDMIKPVLQGVSV